MLSKASATLMVSAALSVAAIWYVHRQQEIERQRMHSGVIRDIERQQLKKTLKSSDES